MATGEQKKQELLQANANKVKTMGGDAIPPADMGTVTGYDPVASFRREMALLDAGREQEELAASEGWFNSTDGGITASDAALQWGQWGINTSRGLNNLAELGVASTGLASDNMIREAFGVTDDTLAAASQSLRGMESARLRNQRARLEASIARDEAENAIQYADNPTMRTVADMVDTLRAYTNNPAVATALLVQTLPDLATGAVIAKGGANVALKRAARNNTEMGATLPIAPAVAARISSRGGENALAAYTAIQTAGSGTTAIEDKFDSPAMREQVLNQLPANVRMSMSIAEQNAYLDAQETLAKQIAAPINAVMGVATTKFMPNIETSIIAPAMSSSIGKAVGNIAGKSGVETVQEVIQGGSENVTGNFALQQVGSQEGLTSGLGRSIAESGIGGFGAGLTGAVTGETLGALGKGASKLVSNRAAKQKASQEAADAALSESITPEAFNRLPKDKQDVLIAAGLYTPEGTDHGLIEEGEDAPAPTRKINDPALNRVINTITNDADKGGLSSPANFNAVYAGMTDPNVTPEGKRQLVVLANDILNNIEAHVASGKEVLANPDQHTPEDVTFAENLVKHYEAALASEPATNVRTEFDALPMDAAEIDSILDQIDADVDAAKVQIQPILAQLAFNPTSVTPEQAETLLAKQEELGFTDTEIAALNVAKSMADVSNDVRYGNRDNDKKGIHEYIADIQNALAKGNTDAAQEALIEMNSFLAYMREKKKAFDDAAKRYAAGDRDDNGFTPVLYENGDPYQSLDGEDMYYHPVKSKGLIKTIPADVAAIEEAMAYSNKLMQDAANKVTTSKPIEEMTDADITAESNRIKQQLADENREPTAEEAVYINALKDQRGYLKFTEKAPSMSEEQLNKHLKQYEGKYPRTTAVIQAELDSRKSKSNKPVDVFAKYTYEDLEGAYNKLNTKKDLTAAELQLMDDIEAELIKRDYAKFSTEMANYTAEELRKVIEDNNNPIQVQAAEDLLARLPVDAGIDNDHDEDEDGDEDGDSGGYDPLIPVVPVEPTPKPAAPIIPTAPVRTQKVYTREGVEADPDSVYLFGDNLADARKGYIPKLTQAVIRGLKNAIGIPTKRDRGIKPFAYFTEADLEEFKDYVDTAIHKAIATGKPIVIPEDGIGTGAAELATRAPALAEYLNKALADLLAGTYTTPAPMDIWYGSDANKQFSNLAPRAFEYGGRKYRSVEHAYQTLKSGTYDEDTYKKYWAAKPGTKITGNRAANTEDNYNVQLMHDLVRESFAQNPAAAKALVATGDARLTHLRDKGIWQTEFPAALRAARSSQSVIDAANTPAPTNYVQQAFAKGPDDNNPDSPKNPFDQKEYAPIENKHSSTNYLKIGYEFRPSGVLQTTEDVSAAIMADKIVGNTESETQALVESAGVAQDLREMLYDRWKTYEEGDYLQWTRYPTLYFTQLMDMGKGKGNEYFLPKVVTDAAGYAIAQWFESDAINTLFNDDIAVNSILGLDTKSKTNRAQLDALQTIGLDWHLVIEALARDINGALGLKVIEDITPAETHSSIAHAIATEAFNYMLNKKLLVLNSITNGELDVLAGRKPDADAKGKRYFVKMNENYDKAVFLAEVMGKSNGILQATYNPTRTDTVASILKPVTQHNTMVKGTDNNIPDLALQARNKANNQAFYLDKDMHTIYEAMGVDGIRQMLGILDENNVVEKDEKRVKGVNATINRDIRTFNTFMERLRGIGLDDIYNAPIYFAYDIISNMRLMMKSGDLNMQRSKLHRGLVTPGKQTVDRNNEQHMLFHSLGVAQGLGIDVDKQDAKTSLEELAVKLEDPNIRFAIEAIKGLLVDGTSFEGPVLDGVLKGIKAGKGKTHTLQALLGQAQLEIAEGLGADTFDTQLTIEIDGITNGPFNALMQLGITEITADMLKKLQKGGLFYGLPDMTYADAAAVEGFKDNYETPAAMVEAAIKRDEAEYIRFREEADAAHAFAKANPSEDSIAEATALDAVAKQLQAKLESTRAARKLLGDIKLLENENKGDNDDPVGRGLLKIPTTISIYGAGPDKASDNFTKAIVNGFYKTMTDIEQRLAAATDQGTIDAINSERQQVIQQMNLLTRRDRLWGNDKNAGLSGTWDDNNINEETLTLSAEQIENINNNIKHGIGAYITDATTQHMGDTTARGKLLILASNVMYHIFMSEYDRALAAMKDKLVAEGKMSKYASLTIAEIAAVKQSVIKYMPAFNTWFTAGETAVSKYNQLASLTDSAKKMATRRVYSVTTAYNTEEGQIRTEKQEEATAEHTGVMTFIPTYEKVSVKAMPQLILALDAAMQAYAQLDGSVDALNVFDGYIVNVMQLQEGHTAINAGVANSHTQFNLMQDFFNRFSEAITGYDFSQLSQEARNTIGKSINRLFGGEFIKGDVSEQAFKNLITGFTEHMQSETNIQQAGKDALLDKDIPSGVTQMSVGDLQYSINSEATAPATQEELLAGLVDKYNANLAVMGNGATAPITPPTPTPAPTPAPAPIVEEDVVRAAVTSIGSKMEESDEVHSLNVSQLKLVIDKLLNVGPGVIKGSPKVFRKIAHNILNALPANAMMYVGTPEGLKAIQHLMTPESLAGFGAKLFTGEVIGLSEGLNNYSGVYKLETIMHEMLHAATAGLVTTYYSPNRDKLTEEQQLAVRTIEGLMRDFYKDTQGKSADPKLINQVKTEVLGAGVRRNATDAQKAFAVSEFISWGLTNVHMQIYLSGNPINRYVRGLLNKLTNAIARLFHIEQTNQLQALFSSTAVLANGSVFDGNASGVSNTNPMIVLPENTNSVDTLTASQVHNRQSNDHNSAAHTEHLDSVGDHIQNVLNAALLDSTTPESMRNHIDKLLYDSTDPDIDPSANEFLAHGFRMSGKENHVFKQVQQAMKFALNTNGFSARQARKMFMKASKALTPTDFLDNPNDTSAPALLLAQQRYDAVFGTTAATDANTRLANFLALATTNEQFRTVLGNQKIANAIIPTTAGMSSRDKVYSWITAIVQSAINFAGSIVTSGSFKGSDMKQRIDVLAKNLTNINSQGKLALATRMYAHMQTGAAFASSRVLAPIFRPVGRVVDTGLDKMVTYGVNRKNTKGPTPKFKLNAISSYLPNATDFTINTATWMSQAARGFYDPVQGEANRLALTEYFLRKPGRLGVTGEFFFEMMSTNSTNAKFHSFLSKTKNAIDATRQDTRENLPKNLQGEFAAPLTKEEKEAFNKVLGMTDASYLFANGYSLEQIQGLLADPVALTNEITRLGKELQKVNSRLFNFYVKSAAGLGKSMVTGHIVNEFQLDNATQIASMAGTGIDVDSATTAAAKPIIDALASLYALSNTSTADRSLIADLINKELAANGKDNGVTYALKMYRVMADQEMVMSDKYGGIGRKGYVPTISDPNNKLVMASAADAGKTFKRLDMSQGAKMERDPTDSGTDGMFLYHTNTGGNPRWIATGMNITERAVAGVNPRTGRNVGSNGVPGVYGPTEVAAVTRKKVAGIRRMMSNAPMSSSTHMVLQPRVVNGIVRGYEYRIPNAHIDALTKVNHDFTQVLGNWAGRLHEEQLGQESNKVLVDLLAEQHREGVNAGKGHHYITIDPNSDDGLIRDIYSVIPSEMKKYAKKYWKDGLIRVRKDLLNNTMGTREVSILNAYDNPRVLAAAIKIAEKQIGPEITKYMRLGGRGLQELVGHLKNWIVVRTGTVAADNIMSNMAYAASIGMNLPTTVSDVSQAAIYAEDYRKNAMRISHLTDTLNLDHGKGKEAELQRELDMLNAEQERNPIKPLIDAGLNPTISEDLNQQDEYGVTDALFTKLKGYLKNVPTGTGEWVKEGLLTQDSRFYFALNKVVQYGDFTFKYAVYKHLMQNEGYTSEQALLRVSSEFVNYTLIPSRTRQALDDIGMTWFMNYKIRITRVVLRNMRENPLAAITAMSQNTIATAQQEALWGTGSYNTMGGGLTQVPDHPLAALFGG